MALLWRLRDIATMLFSMMHRRYDAAADTRPLISQRVAIDVAYAAITLR